MSVRNVIFLMPVVLVMVFLIIAVYIAVSAVMPIHG